MNILLFCFLCVACSRRREELKNSRPDLSIHCSEDGNYDELQCDNGLCWCVEPKTGKLVEKVYPESMINLLPCCKCKKKISINNCLQNQKKKELNFVFLFFLFKIMKRKLVVNICANVRVKKSQELKFWKN